MSFDPQRIFGSLTEKEKIKGHHSPEGRAIRTLSRALHGWSMRNLSAQDVLVLCDQAVEDWLKARLKLSPWSARALPKLTAAAVEHKLITRAESLRLQRMHHRRAGLRDEHGVTAAEVTAVLEFCVQLVEKHW